MSSVLALWEQQFSGLSFCAGRIDGLPPLDERNLSPELSNACLKRRREYLAGRHCAGKAIRLLAEAHRDLSARQFVGRKADGSPDWPSGITGSITHSGDYAGAVVGRTTQYASVGLDVERRFDAAQTRRLYARILTDACRESAASESCDLSLEDTASLFFSAKEAVYKCLSPLSPGFLDFSDIELKVSWETLAFSVSKIRRPVQVPYHHLKGSFTFGDDVIWTLARLERGL